MEDLTHEVEMTCISKLSPCMLADLESTLSLDDMIGLVIL